MAFFTLARALTIGTRIASKRGKKPTMNGKKFKEGMEQFGERAARGFIQFIEDRMDSNYTIDFIGVTFTKRQLIDILYQRKSMILTKRGEFEDIEISYSEIWYFFEYGRLDKGILPKPVLNKLYKEYKELYVKALKKELTHKRKKR